MTLRSKVNIILGAWMYMTHCFMVIHPCAKYGMQMSKQKNCFWPDRNLHRQIERQTDRWTDNDSYIPPWTKHKDKKTSQLLILEWIYVQNYCNTFLAWLQVMKFAWFYDLNKRSNGPHRSPLKQFHSINTFVQIYDYTIMLINLNKFE